jgi:acyl-CoA synthetase (AMP-forming)/AMP-acid ligase II
MPANANTIPALLADRAATRPDLEAIVDSAGHLDYAALERSSAERAAWLVARGVNKTHRVALQMENGIEWAVNAYAVMRIGAVLVPLSTLLRPGELSAQLGIGGVRHLITTGTWRGRDYHAEAGGLDRSMLPSLRTIWHTSELGGETDSPARGVADALSRRVVPADDMVVIFTSGSRQEPRGVIHSHGAAIRSIAAGLEARCVKPGTRLYIPMPFFWVGGFGMGLITALVAGATLLTEAQPEPEKTLKFLERERATLFRGWPDQAASLARHPDFAATDLSGLTPGSLNPVLPPALQARPGARANLFGMTESFGAYCGNPLDRDMPPSKWGSCGKPFDGTWLRIADPATGAILGPDETGTIQVGGRNILRGICGLEREQVFTADGWYDTGDIGHLDADGFLWFAGRRDDMVKISGATVYPSEVEAALETIPGVARAFATDLTLDGKAAIGAALVLAKGAVLDIASAAAAARDRLSMFKVPSRWAILSSAEDPPRNSSGKIDKAGLQALLISSRQAPPRG